MENNKSWSKQFFLISFLPAIAYWYLEANYPLRIALFGGLTLAVVELVLEKIFTKHLHTISKFNFFLILFLGIISLGGEDGLWFKLQPFFTGLVMGSYLLFKNFRGNSLLLEMAQALKKPIPSPEIIETLERHMSWLLIGHGCLMGIVAWKASTDLWLFGKTVGFYIVFAVFMAIEIIWLRLRMKKLAQESMQREILKRMQINKDMSENEN